MHLTSLVSLVRLAFVAFVASACSPEPNDPVAAPDAAVPHVPLDPSGTFVVHSTYALAAPPPELAPLLAELSAATDGVDDPSGYLVDLVVAELPEGTARTIGSALAPYVAWYVNSRLSEFAPSFVPSVRAMATGAQRIATRFGTIEELRIVADGEAKTDDPLRTARVRRTIVGAQFDDVAMRFDDLGLPDATIEANASVETFASSRVSDQLAIATHEVSVPFAAWFRAGFDRAVIPSAVPGATDVASAMRTLVSCPRLGVLIAEALEVGSPLLYAQACSIGIGVGARAIYARFPSASDTHPYRLVLTGSATPLDYDKDGVMDSIADGEWTGRLDATAIGAAFFDGVSR